MRIFYAILTITGWLWLAGFLGYVKWRLKRRDHAKHP